MKNEHRCGGNSPTLPGNTAPPGSSLGKGRHENPPQEPRHAFLRLLFPQPETSYKEPWLLEAFASASSASVKGHQHLPLKTWMSVHGWHPLAALFLPSPTRVPQMPGFLKQYQSDHVTLPISRDSTQLPRQAIPSASHCRLTSPFLARHPTYFCITHSAFLRRLMQRTLCLGGARHSVPTTVQPACQAPYREVSYAISPT